jgi:hypothetical protein
MIGLCFIIGTMVLTSCMTAGISGESWQTDCGAFVTKVRSLAQTAGGVTFVNSDYGVLNRTVTWDMTFKEAKKGDDNKVKPVFDLTEYGIAEKDGFYMGFTPDAAGSDAWLGIAAGARIRINGVVKSMFFGRAPTGGPLVMVSIDKVKLVPIPAR